MTRQMKLGVLAAESLSAIFLFGAHPVIWGGPSQTTLKWSRSTPLPEPTSGYGVGVIQDQLILAGGTYWEGSAHHWTKKVFSATTYSFDPATTKWQRLPDQPIRLGYAASAVIDDTLFVLGGYDGHRVSREIFTLSKDHSHYVWKRFGTMPVDRVFAQAIAVGKKIYLLGGSENFEPMDPIGTCCITKTATRTAMVFDTASPEKGWRELPSYPGGIRWNFTASTDGHSLWVFGGQNREVANGPAQNFLDVLRFDLETNRWTVAGRLPQDLSNDDFVSPVYVAGKIILVSGMNKVWQFDPGTQTYTELAPFPIAAYVDRFVWSRNRLVGAGGENTESGGPRRRSDATFLGQFVP